MGMRRFGIFIRVSLLVALSLGGFSLPKGFSESKGVVVKRQIEPRYPAWAYNHGVSKGFAKIAFYVDEEGEISELMPIEYSHEAFAEELMTTVLKWSFRPARQDGQPVKSVTHAYWEFLPDRPIETNAFYDTAKRMGEAGNAGGRAFKYREGGELDSRIGMLSFPGLMVQVGDLAVEAGLESVRARVVFFVKERGEVALPKVLDSTHPKLDSRLEAAMKVASFAVPTYEGEATLALLERTYDFPIVWIEGAVPETL